MIEELDDILEELANEAAVYGERRSCWVSDYRDRITRSVAVGKAIERRCQCPIEDYRDLPEGGRCLVCGGHTK